MTSNLISNSPLICPDFIGAKHAGLCRIVVHYCERPGAVADLWGEPFNAVTNIAFLVAAWMAWSLIRQMPPETRRAYRVFPPLLFLVGLGSFVFHTVATRWAEWGDVIPILLFMVIFLWFAARQLLHWQPIPTLAALCVFFVATFYLEDAFSDALWGGTLYLPALLVIGGLAASLHVQGSPVAKPMLTAFLVFLASCTARTLDRPFCRGLPMGTHFLWHLLNGTLLYLLVRVLVLNSRETAASRAGV